MNQQRLNGSKFSFHETILNPLLNLLFHRYNQITH